MGLFNIRIGWHFYNDDLKQSFSVGHKYYKVKADSLKEAIEQMEDKLNLHYLKHPMYYGACGGQINES